MCDFMFPAVWHQAAVPLLTVSRLASARPGKHLLRFPGLLESGKDFIGEKKTFLAQLLLLLLLPPIAAPLPFPIQCPSWTDRKKKKIIGYLFRGHLVHFFLGR